MIHAEITLPPGTVHLWQIPLEPREGAWAFLSRREGDQARRFRQPVHRDRYVAAHGALRCILARYLGCLPGSIAFAYGEHGKPELASELRFNLAHSEDLALVAITWDRRIGVDLEFLDPAREVLADAARFFSADEQEALRGLPLPLGERAFHHIWVRKEALLKALGTGIGQGLDQFAVSLEEGDARLLRVDPSLTHGDWTLEAIPIPGFAAALAVEHSPVRVESYLWDWEAKPGNHEPEASNELGSCQTPPHMDFCSRGEKPIAEARRAAEDRGK